MVVVEEPQPTPRNTQWGVAVSVGRGEEMEEAVAIVTRTVKTLAPAPTRTVRGDCHQCPRPGIESRDTVSS